MKTRWEYLEFADCIDKIVYTNKIKRKDFLVKGEYRIISQEENYINGYWNAESDLFKIIKPVVIFGDHTKNLKYIDFDFVLGADGVKIFQPIDCINTKYFYYFLKSVKLKDLGYARHYRLLKEIKVPLPPIPEQKRIVKILDEAFAAIDKARANAEKNLQNSRELFDSYLNKVFANPGEDWEEKKLDNVCLVERGSSPRPIKKYLTTNENGVNWIKIGDTKGINKYLSETKEKITPEGAKKSRFVKEGDFILSNSMSFGNPYIMKTSGYIHDGWFVLRLKDYIDTDFFYYLLISPFVQNQFNTLSSGAIVKNINSDLVKQAVLTIPSLNEQKKIAKEIEKQFSEIQKLESIYLRKSEDLDELKKSILQKAFDGEL